MGQLFPALQHLALSNSVRAEVPALHDRSCCKLDKRVAIAAAKVAEQALKRSKARDRRRSSSSYEGSDDEDDEDVDDATDEEAEKAEGGMSDGEEGHEVDEEGDGDILTARAGSVAVPGAAELSHLPLRSPPLTSVIGWTALLRLPRGLHRLELGTAVLAFESYALLRLRVDELVCHAVASPAAQAALDARRQKRKDAGAAAASGVHGGGPGGASGGSGEDSE